MSPVKAGKVWKDYGPIPSERQVDDLVDEITQHLQGKPPMLIGAALADIVSIFFAGHHPEMRDHAIAVWTETMLGLIEPNEHAIFERYGLPEGWQTEPTKQ